MEFVLTNLHLRTFITHGQDHTSRPHACDFGACAGVASGTGSILPKQVNSFDVAATPEQLRGCDSNSLGSPRLPLGWDMFHLSQ